MKTTILRSYHRNGQIYQEAPLCGGVQHGIVRTWHRNGKPDTELPYQNGLLHGVCRQWSETGKMLGVFEMIHGTGLQQAWHDNGKLQSEFFTLEGHFSGRSRAWVEDGTLVFDELFLNDREVSPEAYRKAASQDERLPKLRGKIVKVDGDNPKHAKHLFNVLVTRLLRKSSVEARKWLAAEDGKRRSLGLFRVARHALKSRAGKFVEDLYQAGALEILVLDISFSKTRDQFADYLMVRLPKDKAKRASIRIVCVQLKASIMTH
jgi:hypothetical protein